MKKKLNLKSLEVKSFTTATEETNIKGGWSIGTCIDCITKTCPNPCGTVEMQ